MISVIIPVYNVAPYLREALDSVINQTYKDLEILIIDDGSTDGSSEICDDYTSYPRVIVQHQPNLGLSTARNTGLDMITGDYVAFLDSDDAYHPDCIRSMAVAMDDADLVISKYTLNYTKGKLEQKGIVWPAINSGMYDRITALNALYNNKINANVWNRLYRAELWRDLRFSEGHNFEDIEIAYRIIDRCSRICVINDSLYFHRKRSDSITVTFSWKNIDDQLLAISRVEDFIRSRSPAVFSEEQVKKKELSYVRKMINCYGESFKLPDENGKREELRTRILQKKDEIPCSIALKDRTAQWMISHNPTLFRLTYIMRQQIRQPLKRIKDR